MSASSEKALWKVMSWSNGATTGDRTSTKPLPLISDPLNSLLMPHHNQDTIRPMSPAESNLQTRSDIIPGRHTDASPTSVSHPHSGTTTSTVNESNTRSYMPQPPPLLGLSPDRPPPPSASHITTSIEPHYSAGSGKPFRNLPPPISGSGLGDGTRMGPTSNSYNPRLQSTSTSVSVVPDSEPRVPTPSTDTPTTQSMHREADEDHNSRAGSLKQPSSPDHDYSSSKPGNAEDMLLRFFNALGQHLSEGATGSSSSPSSPSPPPTQPQAPATPRRPGFDRRLQAQRDCNFIGNINNAWLSFKKDEILYTDGKKSRLNSSRSQDCFLGWKVHHTPGLWRKTMMANVDSSIQNRHSLKAYSPLLSRT